MGRIFLLFVGLVCEWMGGWVYGWVDSAVLECLPLSIRFNVDGNVDFVCIAAA